MYGELDCDILLTQTNGVTTYLYVHDGIVVYESRITDLGDGRTVSEERMLITDISLDGTDVTGGRTNLGYVEAGSWIRPLTASHTTWCPSTGMTRWSPSTATSPFR